MLLSELIYRPSAHTVKHNMTNDRDRSQIKLMSSLYDVLFILQVRLRFQHDLDPPGSGFTTPLIQQLQLQQ